MGQKNSILWESIVAGGNIRCIGRGKKNTENFQNIEEKVYEMTLSLSCLVTKKKYQDDIEHSCPSLIHVFFFFF